MKNKEESRSVVLLTGAGCGGRRAATGGAVTNPEETFRGTMRGCTPDGDFSTVIVTRKGLGPMPRSVS